VAVVVLRQQQQSVCLIHDQHDTYHGFGLIINVRTIDIRHPPVGSLFAEVLATPAALPLVSSDAATTTAVGPATGVVDDKCTNSYSL
jgi:hypothetical protein